ncbi:hypothetical protein ACLB2K_022405 [Fragaria x ananassa]
MIETRECQLLNVSDCAGYYDPLQYPLLLAYGTYGWDINSRSNNNREMTCRAYYAYVLQIRPHEDSILLRGGRLLQQYVVDNYVKIETQKLRYIRNNQADLRCEFYDGLQDSLNVGEDNADTTPAVVPGADASQSATTDGPSRASDCDTGTIDEPSQLSRADQAADPLLTRVDNDTCTTSEPSRMSQADQAANQAAGPLLTNVNNDTGPADQNKSVSFSGPTNLSDN